MKRLLLELKTPLLISLIFLLLCGAFYPLFMTGMSKVLFPKQAAGSLITVHGKVVGSELIGQKFTDARFMKGRPSSVNYNTYTKKEKTDGTYTGVASGSNNYATTNPKLKERVKVDMATFLADNPTISKKDIPTDLLTASGSGLDPNISYQSALIQIPAMAKASGLSQAAIKQIVDLNTEDKLVQIFGEKTVNVLRVNIAVAQKLKLL